MRSEPLYRPCDPSRTRLDESFLAYYKRRVSEVFVLGTASGIIARKHAAADYPVEREASAYRRLNILLADLTYAWCPEVLYVDSTRNIIETEFVPGEALDKALGGMTSDQWARAWSILLPVLVKAQRLGVHFDCDPSNIILDRRHGLQLAFIDPDCIDLDLDHYTALVLFTGLIKSAVRSGPRPLRLRNQLKTLHLAMVSYCEVQALTRAELYEELGAYMWSLVRSNLMIKGNDRFVWRVFRVAVLVPFWAGSASFFQIASRVLGLERAKRRWPMTGMRRRSP